MNKRSTHLSRLHFLWSSYSTGNGRLLEDVEDKRESMNSIPAITSEDAAVATCSVIAGTVVVMNSFLVQICAESAIRPSVLPLVKATYRTGLSRQMFHNLLLHVYFNVCCYQEHDSSSRYTRKDRSVFSVGKIIAYVKRLFFSLLEF